MQPALVSLLLPLNSRSLPVVFVNDPATIQVQTAGFQELAA
jgi:hypothetical protein